MRVPARKDLAEQYIRKIFLSQLKTEGASGVVKIKGIDSEKQRVFQVDVSGKKFILKINIPFWDEENSLMKMLNEQSSLKMLESKNFLWAPKLYSFEKEKDLFNAEIIVMEHAQDSRKIFNRQSIASLAEIILTLHKIVSREFTAPFGDVEKKNKGDGFDFINSYLRLLEDDMAKILISPICKKLDAGEFIKAAFKEIKKNIFLARDLFKKTKNFSFLHCHLVRDEERRHVIISESGELRVIDWESACFGEKELELASFLYENFNLRKDLKRFLIDLVKTGESISFEKIHLYTGLLILDDLIEDLKKTELTLRIKMGHAAGSSFLKVYHRQRKLLIETLN